MNRKTIIISAFIKRTKLHQNGEAPIFIRITVKKERAEFSLYRTVKPNIWDKTKGKAKGNSESSNSINELIDNVKNKLYQSHLRLEKEGLPITAVSIKTLFAYGETKHSPTFLEYCQSELAKMEKLTGIDFTISTIKKQKITLRIFQQFLQSCNCENVTLAGIDPQLIPNFIFYLKTERKCQHNT